MMKVIGKTTTYTGTEHRYMNGCKVRIVAVLKNALNPDIDRDGLAYVNINNDEELDGVTAFDRIEVQPWIAKEGRFSFVTSDPKAVDLACFSDLTK